MSTLNIVPFRQLESISSSFCRRSLNLLRYISREGDTPIEVTGVLVLPFRVEICGFVPLRVLKPKMTSSRVLTVP